MGQCPFCKGAISSDLLVYGGSCPKCLIEIPGEEAPTNPGEQAIARQQAEVAAASGGRGKLVGLVAVLLVGVVGAGSWAVLKGTQPQIVQLDEESYTTIPLAAHENLYEDEGEGATAGTTAKGTASSSGSSTASTASSSSGSSTATGGQLAASSSTTSPGRASINPAAGSLSKQVEDIDPTAASGSPGMMSGPSISVGSRSAAETLTDPAKIADMIKRVVSRNSRQLQDCYNDRLKVSQDLEGRWRVSFEVQKNGSVSKIGVTGLTVADGDLESCMSGKVARWRFQRIKDAQQVSKNYSFTH